MSTVHVHVRDNRLCLLRRWGSGSWACFLLAMSGQLPAPLTKRFYMVVLFSFITALFSFKIFCKIDTVALSFVFDKYCLIMD
jgi:hypothetical protein